MGCDIHLHTEVKINGRWEHYSECHTQRWYRLFNKMAGVRANDDEEDPISLPKGMPEDASTLTQYICNYWKDDGHSHSWLDCAEIRQLEEWLDEIGIRDAEVRYWGYFFGNTWGGFKPGQYGIEDVRFVFWFDN